MSLVVNPVIKRLVEQTPQTFERLIVCAAIHSYRFYSKHRELICPFVGERWRRDFATGRYNDLWPIIDSAWRLYTDLDPALDYTLPKPELLAALSDVANGGGMDAKLAQDLFTEIEEDFYRPDWRPENFVAIVQGQSLAYWMDVRVSKQLTNQLHNASQLSFLTLDKIEEMVKEERNRISRTSDIGAVYMPDLLYGSMRYSPMMSSGIGPLDDALGGGFERGSTTMAAAANGFGKTVLATQIALALAKQKVRVVIITTEETPLQLMHRVVSNQLTIPMTELSVRRDVTQETEVYNIPDGILENPALANKIEELQQALNYLTVIDWSKGQGYSVPEHMDAKITELAETGWDPQFIILDWVGGSLSAASKPDHLRHMYQQATDHVVNHCKRHQRTALILAQLDKSAAKGKKRVRMHMLSECKTMSNNVVNFIGMSCLEDIDTGEDFGSSMAPVQFFNVDKARRGPKGWFAVETVFKFQRFVPKKQQLVGGG